jgi:predicted Zn-dependent protease with MMP-like domain
MLKSLIKILIVDIIEHEFGLNKDDLDLIKSFIFLFDFVIVHNLK